MSKKVTTLPPYLHYPPPNGQPKIEAIEDATPRQAVTTNLPETCSEERNNILQNDAPIPNFLAPKENGGYKLTPDMG